MSNYILFYRKINLKKIRNKEKLKNIKIMIRTRNIKLVVKIKNILKFLNFLNFFLKIDNLKNENDLQYFSKIFLNFYRNTIRNYIVILSDMYVDKSFKNLLSIFEIFFKVSINMDFNMHFALNQKEKYFPYKIFLIKKILKKFSDLTITMISFEIKLGDIYKNEKILYLYY